MANASKNEAFLENGPMDIGGKTQTEIWTLTKS